MKAENVGLGLGDSQMPEARDTMTRFEGADPILNVRNMSVSLKYYVDMLGFKKADCLVFQQPASPDYS